MVHQRRWWAVMIIGLSTLMVSVDLNIVVVALPPMAQHFQVSPALMPLVMLTYAIALVILLLPTGRWVMQFRPFTVFSVVVAAFCLASAFCGLAQNYPMLLIGRTAQGICAAFITTMGTAFTAAVVSSSERGKAMGIFTAISTVGLVLGSTIGGFLVTYFGWSSIFFVNVPLCVIVILLAWMTLGSLTREAAFGEGKAAQGLLSSAMSLLRVPRFFYVLLCYCSFGTIASAVYFLLPFDFSLVEHFSSSTTGLILLGIPLGVIILSLVGGHLIDRYGARPIVLSGIVVILAGILLQFFVVEQQVTPLDVSWRLFITGCGMGLFSAGTQTLLVNLSPKQALGMTGALTGLAKYAGVAIGPVIVSAVWLFIPKTSTQMTGGMLAIAILAFLSLGLAWVATREISPADTREQASEIAQQ